MEKSRRGAFGVGHLAEVELRFSQVKWGAC